MAAPAAASSSSTSSSSSSSSSAAAAAGGTHSSHPSLSFSSQDNDVTTTSLAPPIISSNLGLMNASRPCVTQQINHYHQVTPASSSSSSAAAAGTGAASSTLPASLLSPILVFGHCGLLYNTRRAASVVTECLCDVLVLPKWAYINTGLAKLHKQIIEDNSQYLKQQFTMFANMNSKHFMRLFYYFHFKILSPNQHFIRRHTPADTVYFLVNGDVEVRGETPSVPSSKHSLSNTLVTAHNTAPLYVAGAGTVLGEQSAFSVTNNNAASSNTNTASDDKWSIDVYTRGTCYLFYISSVHLRCYLREDLLHQLKSLHDMRQQWCTSSRQQQLSHSQSLLRFYTASALPTPPMVLAPTLHPLTTNKLRKVVAREALQRPVKPVPKEATIKQQMIEEKQRGKYMKFVKHQETKPITTRSAVAPTDSSVSHHDVSSSPPESSSPVLAPSPSASLLSHDDPLASLFPPSLSTAPILPPLARNAPTISTTNKGNSSDGDANGVPAAHIQAIVPTLLLPVLQSHSYSHSAHLNLQSMTHEPYGKSKYKSKSDRSKKPHARRARDAGAAIPSKSHLLASLSARPSVVQQHMHTLSSLNSAPTSSSSSLQPSSISESLHSSSSSLLTPTPSVAHTHPSVNPKYYNLPFTHANQVPDTQYQPNLIITQSSLRNTKNINVDESSLNARFSANSPSPRAHDMHSPMRAYDLHSPMRSSFDMYSPLRAHDFTLNLQSPSSSSRLVSPSQSPPRMASPSASPSSLTRPLSKLLRTLTTNDEVSAEIKSTPKITKSSHHKDDHEEAGNMSQFDPHYSTSLARSNDAFWSTHHEKWHRVSETSQHGASSQSGGKQHGRRPSTTTRAQQELLPQSVYSDPYLLTNAVLQSPSNNNNNVRRSQKVSDSNAEQTSMSPNASTTTSHATAAPQLPSSSTPGSSTILLYPTSNDYDTIQQTNKLTRALIKTVTNHAVKQIRDEMKHDIEEEPATLLADDVNDEYKSSSHDAVSSLSSLPVRRPSVLLPTVLVEFSNELIHSPRTSASLRAQELSDSNLNPAFVRQFTANQQEFISEEESIRRLQQQHAQYLNPQSNANDATNITQPLTVEIINKPMQLEARNYHPQLSSLNSSQLQLLKDRGIPSYLIDKHTTHSQLSSSSSAATLSNDDSSTSASSTINLRLSIEPVSESSSSSSASASAIATSPLVDAHAVSSVLSPSHSSISLMSVPSSTTLEVPSSSSSSSAAASLLSSSLSAPAVSMTTLAPSASTDSLHNTLSASTSLTSLISTLTQQVTEQQQYHQQQQQQQQFQQHQQQHQQQYEYDQQQQRGATTTGQAAALTFTNTGEQWNGDPRVLREKLRKIKQDKMNTKNAPAENKPLSNNNSNSPNETALIPLASSASTTALSASSSSSALLATAIAVPTSLSSSSSSTSLLPSTAQAVPSLQHHTPRLYHWDMMTFAASNTKQHKRRQQSQCRINLPSLSHFHELNTQQFKLHHHHQQQQPRRSQHDEKPMKRPTEGLGRAAQTLIAPIVKKSDAASRFFRLGFPE